MTQLTDDNVLYAARLSKFDLSPEELSAFKDDLEKILGYVKQLQDVETKNIEPTAQVTGLVNQTRPDEIRDYGVSATELLRNAPETDSDSIKVPKVI